MRYDVASNNADTIQCKFQTGSICIVRVQLRSLSKCTPHFRCTHTSIYNSESLALGYKLPRPFTRPHICRWERQCSGRWILESEMVGRPPSRVCPWRIAKWWSPWSELNLKLLWEMSCEFFNTACHTTMWTSASLARTPRSQPRPLITLQKLDI